jgi:hypothetical protein
MQDEECLKSMRTVPLLPTYYIGARVLAALGKLVSNQGNRVL